MRRKKLVKKLTAVSLATFMFLILAACGLGDPNDDIIISEEEDKKVVNLFSPMEKI